jgi:DNA integrity scanning protein DisA with diadenylate cyclase activity
MEEPIKEFAKIDGAFIVRADGVILSAGTYITTSNISVALPRGLGSRRRRRTDGKTAALTPTGERGKLER